MTRPWTSLLPALLAAVSSGCGDHPEPWYLQRPCEGHPTGCLSIFLNGRRDIKDLKLSYSLYPQEEAWAGFDDLPLQSWSGPLRLPLVRAVDLPTIPPYSWVRILHFRWKTPAGAAGSMDWDFWYKGWTAEADPDSWDLNLRFYLDD